MISFSVAVPIPVRKARKQDEVVREAEAETAALHADLDGETNRVRADVVRLHAELERTRAQIALFAGSIIPQARAALESSQAALASGRGELFNVLQRQQTLLEYRLAHERLRADYAQRLVELESIVGDEVRP